MTKPPPMLNGRELSDYELAELRGQLENKAIGCVSDEMRALIAEQWPHLLAKIGHGH